MRNTIRWWRLDRAGASPNGQTFAGRARTFASGTKQSGSAVLVVERTEAGLVSWVGGRSAVGMDDAAVSLGQAVAARATPVEDAPSLSGVFVGQLRADDGDIRSSQVNADPAELARRLSSLLRVGEWVAATVRLPGKSERKRTQRWYKARIGQHMATHHSLEEPSLLVSMFAGSDDKDRVGTVLDQVAASMAGFDVPRKAVVPSMPVTVMPWLVAAIALWVGGLYAGLGVLLAGVAGVVPALIGVALASGIIRSRVFRLRQQMQSGWFDPPPKRRTPPVRPKKTDDGEQTEGGYPLHPYTFPMSAATAVMLVAPHGGATSGASVTEHRSAPGPLLEHCGPMIGLAGDGTERVHLAASDMFGGIGVTGLPYSGKSVLLRALWGWNVADKASPSGRPGWPGTKNTLVVFESKSDATKYQEWAHAMGGDVMQVDMVDERTWAIDLFAIPGSLEHKVDVFVNAMRYSFADGAIQDLSFDVLRQLITAGMVVTQEMCSEAEVPYGSPIQSAYILSGGFGVAEAEALAHELLGAAEEEPASDPTATDAEPVDGLLALPSGESMSDLARAARVIRPLFGDGVSSSARANKTGAPMNKLAQLWQAEMWWRPSRSKVSWEQILQNHWSVVVNTGQPVDSQLQGLGGKVGQVMSSMLVYFLQQEIARLCVGWQDQGRAVTVMSDELSILAAVSPEVITWMREQGRSFGVRPVFATQRPEQLLPEVRKSFNGFQTMIVMRQSDPHVAEEAARDLSLVDPQHEWTGSEIGQLEPYTAVLRTTVGQRPQPPVPIRLPNFEENISDYRNAQGLDAR